MVPTGLLMLPEWLPGFGGMEPYKRLVEAVTRTVLHPDAVLPFAYDWRLDVEHNARILARDACAHLKRWRDHERLSEVRSRRNDDREPRLVFVAHSMGGLLVRAMSGLAVEQPDTRAVVTLGTPFAGSVKTIGMLATGDGGPRGMPADATRQACRSMPGLYDLLPWYRCLLRGDDVVALGRSDVVGLGGAPQLVREAFERRARTASGELPGHRAVVGIGQKTPQSLEFRGSDVVTHAWGYRRNSQDDLIRESGRLVAENLDGDGTVFQYSARTAATEGIPVAQHHQSLAVNRASLHIVQKVITGATDLDTVLGQALNETPLGLETQDEIRPNQPLEIRIRSDHTPADITCAVEDTARRDAVVRRPLVRGRRDEGAFIVRTDLEVAGLYRVRVSAGNAEVTKLVLVGADPIGDR
ncbi:Lecithin:cholesterol acyltransferase [Jiangella sp. DSM 45060]|nr:Lecithin:cholesterol acyltransferase [Jiangella sp. DSM 45060]